MNIQLHIYFISLTFLYYVCISWRWTRDICTQLVCFTFDFNFIWFHNYDFLFVAQGEWKQIIRKSERNDGTSQYICKFMNIEMFHRFAHSILFDSHSPMQWIAVRRPKTSRINVVNCRYTSVAMCMCNQYENTLGLQQHQMQFVYRNKMQIRDQRN